jgi:hypothetical protein
VIAGRIRDDAGSARIGRQLRQHVARTSDLEGAAWLEVLAFEAEGRRV